MAQWLRSVRTGRCVQADVFSVAFDVWPGGSILSVRDKTETQLSGTWNGRVCFQPRIPHLPVCSPDAEKVVRGTSIMYCSAGLDARLVYTVELHRRRNALLNKVGWGVAA